MKIELAKEQGSPVERKWSGRRGQRRDRAAHRHRRRPRRAGRVAPLIKRHHLLLVTLLLMNSAAVSPPSHRRRSRPAIDAASRAAERGPAPLSRRAGPQLRCHHPLCVPRPPLRRDCALPHAAPPSRRPALTRRLIAAACRLKIPSAIFTGPRRLQLSAALTPLVWCFMFATFAISFPLAWLLDKYPHLLLPTPPPPSPPSPLPPSLPSSLPILDSAALHLPSPVSPLPPPPPGSISRLSWLPRSSAPTTRTA